MSDIRKKKKKKKKKKKGDAYTTHLSTPSSTLSPSNQYNDDDPFSSNTNITSIGGTVITPTATATATVTEPRLIAHIFASKIQLFKLDIVKKDKIDLGKKVVAIVPTEHDINGISGNTIFSVICYEPKSRRLVLSVSICNTFNLGILATKSLSFNDKKGDLYSFTFGNDSNLYEFVCAVCMARIYRNDINTDNHKLLIQDLNNVNNMVLSVNSETSKVTTKLSIWLSHKHKHPYKRKNNVWNGQKIIDLKNGKWLMPAIDNALKGMRINGKKLIIAPPQYGFGDKGNTKLFIPRNSTLIIELELKSIEQSKKIQYNTDISLLNDDYKSGGKTSVDLHHFKKKNAQLKQEILRLNSRITDLLKENTKLKRKIDFHQIQNIKEKNTLKDAVQLENDKLQSNLNQFGGKFESYSLDIDYTKKHYLEWNSEDVVDWILSLNYGSFAKYSSLLTKNVSQQNIKGKHLSKISKNEWRSCGILDFDDQLSIVDHVKALTMKEKKTFTNNFDNFANTFDPNTNLFD